MKSDALHHQEPVQEGMPQERAQGQTPEKPSHSWIQAITRLVKNRTLRIVGLSLAVHGAAAATPIFTKDEPNIAVAKTGLGKALRSLEETNLITLLNDNDELIKTLNAQNAKKVKEKTTERAARIDPVKIEAYKPHLKEQLSKGKKIRFTDFFEKYEELVMGIDPADIQKGKDFFLKQMAELKSHKDKITDKRMLEMLTDLIYDAKEDYSGEDDSETSVFEYLASQADAEQKDNAVLKGNCKTRYKKMVMGVEELFPGQENDIFIQRFDDAVSGHFRAGFRLNKNESYAFEPGELVQLSDDNKAGTLIQNSQRMIQRYLGLPLESLKAEPGEYTPGGTKPHVHIDDGLSEPLPEGIHLKAASDNPALGHANWDKTVDEIEGNISELEKQESEERAKNGITEMEIFKELNLSTEEIMTILQKKEKQHLEKKDDYIVVDMDIPSAKQIRDINSWQGKLPLHYLFPDDQLFYFSSDALKELTKKEDGSITIGLKGYGLPPAFVDQLDPCELNLERLEIIMGKSGHLPPDQLQKIMSCNTKVKIGKRDKGSGRALWLNNYDMNEEEAGIIAEMNQGGTWLAPGEIMYGDNILKILVTTKASLHITVETSNQIAKYKRQSPWFFENKYYAYMYSQH